MMCLRETVLISNTKAIRKYTVLPSPPPQLNDVSSVASESLFCIVSLRSLNALCPAVHQFMKPSENSLDSVRCH
jgi:hypothetical protein